MISQVPRQVTHEQLKVHSAMGRSKYTQAVILMICLFRDQGLKQSLLCGSYCTGITSLYYYIKYLQIQTIAEMLVRGMLGATSIEKITKISASGRNFLDPLPPPLRKGPYRRKRRYFVPNSNYKVLFFGNFNPPRKPNLIDFYN